ncbi:MAG: hypothetical protein NZ845_04900 [Thermodesulfovibrio sp.]|nr:hypothetical protein [Thermodesulfovibrio sp.]MDW7971742.1 hypothetical protein [Thermodesulfovibrio sp.]
MKSKIFSIIMILASVLFPEILYSQQDSKAYGVWLSVYFDIQNLKMKLKERIKEIDLKIASNQKNIEELNKLLADIQKTKITGTEKQKKDASLAEPIAQQALAKAKETQRILKNQKLELLMELNRINMEEQKLKDLYETLISPKTVGVIRNCSGDVRILKNNQYSYCSLYSTLNEGDMIITGSDGKADITMLDGRGKLTVEPNSRYIITKNTTEEEIGELVKGKMHVNIENSEKHSNKIKEILNSYKEDLKTIKDWTEEKIEKIKREARDKRKKFSIWLCEFFHKGRVCGPEGPTGAPWIAIGARGTEFTYEIDENKAKLSVLEGEVEVTITKNKQTFIIPGGFEAIIKPDGTVTRYRK